MGKRSSPAPSRVPKRGLGMRLLLTRANVLETSHRRKLQVLHVTPDSSSATRRATIWHWRSPTNNLNYFHHLLYPFTLVFSQSSESCARSCCGLLPFTAPDFGTPIQLFTRTSVSASKHSHKRQHLYLPSSPLHQCLQKHSLPPVT